MAALQDALDVLDALGQHGAAAHVAMALNCLGVMVPAPPYAGDDLDGLMSLEGKPARRS